MWPSAAQSVVSGCGWTGTLWNVLTGALPPQLSPQDLSGAKTGCSRGPSPARSGRGNRTLLCTFSTSSSHFQCRQPKKQPKCPLFRAPGSRVSRGRLFTCSWRRFESQRASITGEEIDEACPSGPALQPPLCCWDSPSGLHHCLPPAAAYLGVWDGTQGRRAAAAGNRRPEAPLGPHAVFKVRETELGTS